MSQTGWTPVDESAAKWTPVPETAPAQSGILDKANEYAGKALSAAGLPTSISNIPEWFQHLTGTHPKSEPFWEPVRKAIKEPTEENIVGAVPFVGPASVAMSKDVQKKDYGGALATLAGTVGGVLGAGQVGPGLEAKAVLKASAQGAPIGATIAERMYQSALKPSTALPSARVKGMVRTGLEEGIPVSEGGVQKLGSLVEDLNNKIKAQIDAGSAAGKTVDPLKVASKLGDVGQQFKQQVNPKADLAAIQKSGEEFLEANPDAIPASDAQAMKQGTYKQIKKSYGQLSNATIESQKALARGIKEELVNQFPEIGQLNSRESQLLNLDGALQRAVRRIDNHQIIGIGTPIAAGAAKAVTGSTAVGAVTGILKAVFDDPMIKSRLAIALNKRGVPWSAANAKVVAYTNALANTSPQGGDQESEP